MLGVPRSHLLVRLLTCVAYVGVVPDLVVVVVLLLGEVLSWRLWRPVGQRYPGKQIWALPPIGLSNVASFL